MARISVTGEVQRFLSSEISEGDIVIDATLGNGHDALFLTRHIGDQGQLFGFDIQAEAICNTLNRLAAHQLGHRATVMMQGHEYMADFIPERLHGHIKCIMFNLGYLPGTDKSLTTRIESTLAALNQSCGLLSRDGCISVLAYTGHPGGLLECNAVKAWANQLGKDDFNLQINNLMPEHKNPPEWILVKKSNPDSPSDI